MYFNWSTINIQGTLNSEYDIQVLLFGTSTSVFNETTENTNITFDKNQLKDNTKYMKAFLSILSIILIYNNTNNFKLHPANIRNLLSTRSANSFSTELQF